MLKIFTLQQRFYPEDIRYFIPPYKNAANVEAPLVTDFGNGIPTFVVVSFREILTEKLKRHEGRRFPPPPLPPQFRALF